MTACPNTKNGRRNPAAKPRKKTGISLAPGSPQGSGSLGFRIYGGNTHRRTSQNADQLLNGRIGIRLTKPLQIF